MGAAQSSEINRRQRFLTDEIDYGQRVVGSAAVVGDVGSLAVAGCNNFVRVVAYRDSHNRFQAGRIDDGERLAGLGENEQRIRRRVLSVESDGTECADEQK